MQLMSVSIQHQTITKIIMSAYYHKTINYAKLMMPSSAHRDAKPKNNIPPKVGWVQTLLFSNMKRTDVRKENHVSSFLHFVQNYERPLAKGGPFPNFLYIQFEYGFLMANCNGQERIG